MADIKNYDNEERQLINKIGVKLNQLRESKRLDSLELSRIAKVGVIAIHDLGTDKSPNMTLKTLIRLLSALDSLVLLNPLVSPEESNKVEKPQDDGADKISFRVTFEGKIEVRAETDGESKRFYIEPSSLEYEQAVENALNSLSKQEKENLVRKHAKD